MGYLTRYNLERTKGGSHDAFIARLSDLGLSTDSLDGSEPVKWYDHDADIQSAMLATGVTEVDLSGEGEEQGDVWDKEYRLVNGAVTVAEYGYELVRKDTPEVTTL